MLIQWFKTVLLSSFVLIMVVLLVIFPEQAYNASLLGLNMWWEIVFPSLLPFFITAELLLSFGVVKFFGRLLEPIMRPLFNVPGVGSFAWLMGMVSGYPTGAKISARLREEKELTQIEAERLVSFTNASSPLFIFGAIAVGFFHDVTLGLLIAIAHYGGNLIVGICMRFYGRSKDKKVNRKTTRKVDWKLALKDMHHFRIRNKRPIGMILGDAIIQSIKTLVMVGGFIILFSVLTELFNLIHFTTFISDIVGILFNVLSLPLELSFPFISGIFEITIGVHLISQVDIDALLQKLVVVSFFLGFNGFSIQAQVASMLASTDIRFKPYFFARLLHGLIASLLTILLYQPLYMVRKQSIATDVPVLYPINDFFLYEWLTLLKQFGPLFTLICLFLALTILLKRMIKY
ncbi:sporulation integral membrane protein YlbJ [Cerasibacillus quisquiliarum]|uniref:sporulation integral membrane protein YlbJ n=1 Tax=Cerasibacillus quisquiliarum TaxID=227865 RepID=UPI0011BDF424|nr:sporulation integral membrane protein YlbJ [Cerasibacillus quisquiliarum]